MDAFYTDALVSFISQQKNTHPSESSQFTRLMVQQRHSLIMVPCAYFWVIYTAKFVKGPNWVQKDHNYDDDEIGKVQQVWNGVCDLWITGEAMSIVLIMGRDLWASVKGQRADFCQLQLCMKMAWHAVYHTEGKVLDFLTIIWVLYWWLISNDLACAFQIGCEIKGKEYQASAIVQWQKARVWNL